MAIDFTLTRQQRELQLNSRKFAGAVLAGARVAESLPTPEERFLATEPAYEAMVAAGFLRKCIPAPAGGEGAGLVDMAIMAEELYSVNASVTLTMLDMVLGILPILLGGTPDQCGRLLAPFLRRVALRWPGSVPANQAGAPMPVLRRRVRACEPPRRSKAIAGSLTAGKNEFRQRPGGTAKAPMSCAWCAEPTPTLRPTRQFPS